MSDEYNAARASVADQINAMIGAAGARVEHSNALTSTDGTRAERVTVDSKGVTIHGDVHTPERIVDTGVNLDHQHAQGEARIAKIEAELAAVRYDAKTGAPIQIMQGEARRIAELQLVTARNAHYYDSRRALQVTEQRERDQAFRDAEATERLQYLRVTGGDPKTMARLQELLRDEELKTAAKAILATRFAKMQDRT